MSLREKRVEMAMLALLASRKLGMGTSKVAPLLYTLRRKATTTESWANLNKSSGELKQILESSPTPTEAQIKQMKSLSSQITKSLSELHEPPTPPPSPQDTRLMLVESKLNDLSATHKVHTAATYAFVGVFFCAIITFIDQFARQYYDNKATQKDIKNINTKVTALEVAAGSGKDSAAGDGEDSAAGDGDDSAADGKDSAGFLSWWFKGK